MLVTLNEVLKYAEENNCAIGAFNVPNLECVMAVIAAAEELDYPVIIQHAPLHEQYVPFETIAPIMLKAAKEAKVKVCVHFDHGEDLNQLKRALELGFTSIMYDGSTLPFEENIKNTKIAVEMAKPYGASVEAEIGVMTRKETTSNDEVVVEMTEDMYTDPEDALKFVQETGIDALACSVGNVHGIYAKAPKLDYPRIAKIKELVKIPLVMHGGSGIDKLGYENSIIRGVRKINYYTYMAKAAGEAIAKEDSYHFYHDIVMDAIKIMKENAKQAMLTFSMREKSI